MKRNCKIYNNAGKVAKIRAMELNGMFTVEMAYIVPFILTIFFLSIMGIFYYHDKALTAAAAHETATIAGTKSREKDEVTEAVVSTIFEERIRGKCIVFDNPKVNAKVDKDRITVTTNATKGRIKMSVEENSCITKPEEKIRSYRKLGLKRYQKEGRNGTTYRSKK